VALVVGLDDRGGVAHLDLLVDELVGDGVEAVIHLDVVVDVDPAALPLGQLVGGGGQGHKRRTVQPFPQLVSAHPELLQWPRVQLLQQLPDRLVQLAQLEERAVAQPGHDPSLGYEHRRLHLGFVLGLAGAGRDHDRGVVLGQLLVGAVEAGFVAARTGHRALELVRDPNLRGAAEVLHHPGVGPDPLVELLGPGRLGVGVAAGPEHGDEQLDRDLLPRPPVDQVRALAREVDEGLFAGPVLLAHRGPKLACPAAVDLAELAVAVAVLVDPAVLLPQKVQRHARPLQLLMDPHQVGRRPLPPRRGQHEQPRLQSGVVQLRRERPAEPGPPRPAHVLRHCPHAHPQRPGNRPVAQATLVLQSQDLAYLSHR
jgi:hypothetical protein